MTATLIAPNTRPQSTNGRAPSTLADPNARHEIERRTRQIGRQMLQGLDRGPTVWKRSWWDDQFMAWTMNDPALKTQLFRFIDVLPTLRTGREIRRHLDEYLAEVPGPLPFWIAGPLAMIPRIGLGDQFLGWAAQTAAGSMARRFIAGNTPQEAIRQILRLRGKRMAFTADLLGEAVVTEAEADAYLETSLELLRELPPMLEARPEDPLIDRDHERPIPRMNLSVKLTSLTSRYNPHDPTATADRVLPRLRAILRAARNNGCFINFDMEQYAYKDLTYTLFESVLSEPEFRDWPDVGVVVQAYQHEAVEDVHRLVDFVARRGTSIAVRLVKGAYWDSETLLARQHGWPIPVYQSKWESDACFERCVDLLVDHATMLRPVIGSHNVRSLAYALAVAEQSALPLRLIETQALFGMGEAIAETLVGLGQRVRIYTPYGQMLPGMAYLVRRLLENTSNESFLKISMSGRDDLDDLLRDPREAAPMNRSTPRINGPITNVDANGTSLETLPAFDNEPLSDFAQAEFRETMERALAEVDTRLGGNYSAWIDGRDVNADRTLDSVDPSRTEVVVGRVPLVDLTTAQEAVASAHRAFDGWRATSVADRVAVLLRTAERMRARRFELAAWIIRESGKPWVEADGDVAEAIDFCEYYARQMLQIDQPVHRNVAGQTNRLIRIPRGVALVISPWNFPLAIPCGMVAGALVTGNTVVFKPAEQSPVIARMMVDLFIEAGLPPSALQYVPGIGEEIGPALVDDPRIAMIAFTGSRAVGLEINRRAAETRDGQHQVKRVIAEMGGKNAVIVDDDADLDEAIGGVLASAFGYAGQKCSACSRVIVLDAIYDAFCERLAEAVPSVTIGPADRPDTVIGPVIDAESVARVERYRQIAREEGRVLAEPELPSTLEAGHYVAPLVVADVDPDARIAQEEVFGPILAVIRARDLDDALRIANGTEYALTGGLYSRSPSHIERVQREYLVGNLYINRNITGALVERQPFGGFGLSGIGTKAGGPDYLHEFTLPRAICENTMRRGFSPDLQDELVTT